MYVPSRAWVAGIERVESIESTEILREASFSRRFICLSREPRIGYYSTTTSILPCIGTVNTPPSDMNPNPVNLYAAKWLFGQA